MENFVLEWKPPDQIPSCPWTCPNCPRRHQVKLRRGCIANMAVDHLRAVPWNDGNRFLGCLSCSIFLTKKATNASCKRWSNTWRRQISASLHHHVWEWTEMRRNTKPVPNSLYWRFVDQLFSLWGVIAMSPSTRKGISTNTWSRRFSPTGRSAKTGIWGKTCNQSSQEIRVNLSFLRSQSFIFCARARIQLPKMKKEIKTEWLVWFFKQRLVTHMQIIQVFFGSYPREHEYLRGSNRSSTKYDFFVGMDWF